MIRDAEESDAESVRAIYAPSVTDMAVSFELEVPTVDEMARRISAAEPDYPWLVSEAEGELLGYAYARPFHTRAAYRFSVEITVYVRASSTGRGIGRELIETLLVDLRRRGYAQAFAGIALPNPASVRVFEACGFAHVGTFREVGYKLERWHDVGWWQRAIATFVPES
ncbi:MAG TPA: arsinothricin resistance N-acetyltransferase ArsN1 family B [Actinomycetota bacterium]|nr:arsinothricin resistance N-acetyltransferase ArsN1 family B [Actinomycetota bacterium]